MNVAFALFRYFPFGGMQRDLLTAAQRCRDRGHDVRIYCHTFEGDRPGGIDVRVLPTAGRSNHARAASFANELLQCLRQAPADAVIGFDKMPGLDLYFAADPCFVLRSRARGLAYRLTQRYRTFRRLEAAVFGPQATTRILLLDERQQQSYQQAWQTAAARCTLLPPGIAKDRCRGQDAAQLRQRTRAALELDAQQRMCLLVGANFELKGLDRAITALAHLPTSLQKRTQLLAVGQRPPDKLLQLAQRAGVADHVRMLPGRDDVPALLQAADLLVHPARLDTTGTVLLEALVAGLPVVCTAACGYAQHIETAAAGRVLPEPFQQDDFNRALAELLVNDGEAMRERALAYAATHDLHSMHDRILAEIEAIGHARG